MGTSTFAVLVGLIAYSLLDIINYRDEIRNNAELNAALVGEYCKAPLLFGYKSEVDDALKKLQTIPEVVSACVFDKNGDPFSVYSRDSINVVEYKNLSEHDFTDSWNHLNIIYALKTTGKLDGTIYLRVSTSSIIDLSFLCWAL